MKTLDEGLQKQFESGIIPNDGIESHAYQKVFDALKREPEYSLPLNFADRMMALVESKEKAKEVSRDNLWLGLGISSFLIALIVAFVLTGFKFSFGAFQFFSGYYGLVIFGIGFILLLNWVDKKVVRKTQAF